MSVVRQYEQQCVLRIPTIETLTMPLTHRSRHKEKKVAGYNHSSGRFALKSITTRHAGTQVSRPLLPDKLTAIPRFNPFPLA
jgi:hypothetical protein